MAQRYEYTEGSSSKFWQIELKGTSFTTTHGKIGTGGQTLLKQFSDAATAKKEHDKLVAQKVKKGYQLVEAAAAKPAVAPKTAKKASAKSKPEPETTAVGTAYNEALAKVIDADPDDAAAWSVYADWLQAQGDPRGELAVVQEGLRASPKDAALLKAEKKLLKDHGVALTGPWAKYMTREGKPDLPGVTTKPAVEPDFRDYESNLAPMRVQWRGGFFSEIVFGHPGYDWSSGLGKKKGGDDDEGGDEDGDGEELDVPDMLVEILSSPAARFTTSLRLGMPNSGEDGEASFAGVFKRIAKHEALGRLRSLYIGDIAQEESECSWVYLGDVSKLYPALKKLRSLTLRGSSDLKLGAIDLPELRELTIITGGLDKKNIASICAAKWPKLHTLELWLGSSNYGASSKLKDLAPILDGKAFPKLKNLGLRNCEYGDELAEAIPPAVIVKQLETLDLSKGTMSDVGAAALIAGADSLAHLRRLDLSDNYIGKQSAAAAKICKAVRTRPQRSADEYDDGEVHRYPALGE